MPYPSISGRAPSRQPVPALPPRDHGREGIAGSPIEFEVLRGVRMGGRGLRRKVAAPSVAPHSWQNLLPGGFPLPHCRHRASSLAPQSPQNFTAAGFSCWHRGHCILGSPLRPSPGWPKLSPTLAGMRRMGKRRRPRSSRRMMRRGVYVIHPEDAGRVPDATVKRLSRRQLLGMAAILLASGPRAALGQPRVPIADMHSHYGLITRRIADSGLAEDMRAGRGHRGLDECS